MSAYEVIITLQIMAGTVIMLLSLVSIMKTKAPVPRVITNRHLIAVSLAGLFLTGFVLSLLSLLRDVSFPFELLFGSLFMGSACFVYISFRITADTRSHLEQRTEQYYNAEDKLKGLSLRDGLTGVYNRYGFFTLMDSHLKLALRQKKAIALFYADIDDLKGINNNFGRQEGDMMLKEAGNILKACFRSSDIIARIGEDEFAVLLIGASEDDFESINKHFSRTLEEHNSRRHQKYRLSISSGATSYDPVYNASIDAMLAHVHELAGRNKAQLNKTALAI